MKLKNTLRYMMGEKLISHVDEETSKVYEEEVLDKLL
jgi:hypothetical protein